MMDKMVVWDSAEIVDTIVVREMSLLVDINAVGDMALLVYKIVYCDKAGEKCCLELTIVVKCYSVR